MSDMPERIYAEADPYDFPGYSPCWVWHSAEGIEATDGLTAYLREDAQSARILELEAALREWLSVYQHCSIETGVCCCGDNMANHSNPMDCGHSPTDHGAYFAQGVYEKTLAALGDPQ